MASVPRLNSHFVCFILYFISEENMTPFKGSTSYPHSYSTTSSSGSTSGTSTTEATSSIETRNKFFESVLNGLCLKVNLANIRYAFQFENYYVGIGGTGDEANICYEEETGDNDNRLEIRPLKRYTDNIDSDKNLLTWYKPTGVCTCSEAYLNYIEKLLHAGDFVNLKLSKDDFARLKSYVQVTPSRK